VRISLTCQKRNIKGDTATGRFSVPKRSVAPVNIRLTINGSFAARNSQSAIVTVCQKRNVRWSNATVRLSAFAAGGILLGQRLVCNYFCIDSFSTRADPVIYSVFTARQHAGIQTALVDSGKDQTTSGAPLFDRKSLPALSVPVDLDRSS